MESKYTLPAQERLKSKLLIDKLFRHGKSITSGPIRLKYLLSEGEVTGSDKTIQMMVSVPKKLYPKAVHRNAIKRQIREAYRNQKELLQPIKDKLPNGRLSVAIMFIAKEQQTHRIIVEHLTLLLEQLVADYG
jgi:ribonuclease P protein component